MSATKAWSSAIAPSPPPVPQRWHWAAGIACATLTLVAYSLRYAGSDETILAAEEDSVIVSLGGPARRLEAPPEEVQTAEEAPVVAERAEDAPPPAPPTEARVVAGAADGDGRASSGAGGIGSGPPLPLPPPPPPAPPPPPRITEVSRQFVEISIRAYTSRIIYPGASLDRGEEGRGVLRVTIARDGKVKNWDIVRSTGHGRLDREIQRVAKLVPRLDPLPANFARSEAKVDIPITFAIEYFDPQ
ncbi:MAG: TonB family protein [Erythrobacter sp.]|uniref:energy transducer TonB n=1 Tax=Erythrobacter sp. TaxID=1042 RepID=UPI0032EACB84